MSGTEPQAAKGLKMGGWIKWGLMGLGLVGVAAILYVMAGVIFKPAPVMQELKPSPPRETSLHKIPKLTPPEAAKPAPTAAFVDGSGKSVMLANFKGQVVVLNLWATWCAPCRQEMPSLAALQRAYAGKPLNVVALSIDNEAATDRAKDFIRVNKPLAFYQDAKFALPSSMTPPLDGFPTTLFIDKQGRVRGVVESDVDWAGDKARAAVDQLLAE